MVLTLAFTLVFGQSEFLAGNGEMLPPPNSPPPPGQEPLPGQAPPSEQGQMAPMQTQEPPPGQLPPPEQQVQPAEQTQEMPPPEQLPPPEQNQQTPPPPEEEMPPPQEGQKVPEGQQAPPSEGEQTQQYQAQPPPENDTQEMQSELPPQEPLPPPPAPIYSAPLIKPEEIPQEQLQTYIEENKIEQPLGFVDSDKDGLSDQHEFYMGTDPQVGDSDGDGFEDGKEILQFGTDPNAVTEQTGELKPRVVNFAPEETIEPGPQFILGQAEPGEVVKLYEKNESGELTLLAEATADEQGAYALFSDAELPEGKHDLVLGDSSFTVNVAEPEFKTPVIASEGIEVGTVFKEDETPALTLKPVEEALIVVTWQSTVYSQTLIADASGANIEIEPPADLGPGEHTVTWYSQNLETGQKSQPTQVAFTIANPSTTAFVTGETGGLSPWILAAIGGGVLLALTGLGLVMKKK